MISENPLIILDKLRVYYETNYKATSKRQFVIMEIEELKRRIEELEDEARRKDKKS